MNTYKQAKQAIWNALEAEGWEMSRPTLKVPHATDPNGNRHNPDRIWFKPQALYLNAHSLHIDVRAHTTEQVVAYIHRTIESRNESEYF